MSDLDGGDTSNGVESGGAISEEYTDESGNGTKVTPGENLRTPSDVNKNTARCSRTNMGKADRYVVFGCNNNGRRYPQRMVVKDHVSTLQFFSCPARHSKVWAEHMNQEGLHSLTVNQKVCSNHFVLGRPTEQCPHPVLYMRGYETATKDHSLLDMIRIREATPDDNTYMDTRRGSVKRKAAYEKKSHKEKKEIEIPHDDGDGDNNADVANGDYNAEQNDMMGATFEKCGLWPVSVDRALANQQLRIAVIHQTSCENQPDKKINLPNNDRSKVTSVKGDVHSVIRDKMIIDEQFIKEKEGQQNKRDEAELKDRRKAEATRKES
ncbi:hypothetical protein Bbelb_377240 [Branchiostoma belcheri]|nr:hypothetical protein Bbelb_377240 [Branchiostoma belcheri]